MFKLAYYRFKINLEGLKFLFIICVSFSCIHQTFAQVNAQENDRAYIKAVEGKDIVALSARCSKLENFIRDSRSCDYIVVRPGGSGTLPDGAVVMNNLAINEPFEWKNSEGEMVSSRNGRVARHALHVGDQWYPLGCFKTTNGNVYCTDARNITWTNPQGQSESMFNIYENGYEANTYSALLTEQTTNPRARYINLDDPNHILFRNQTPPSPSQAEASAETAVAVDGSESAGDAGVAESTSSGGSGIDGPDFGNGVSAEADAATAANITDSEVSDQAVQTSLRPRPRPENIEEDSDSSIPVPSPRPRPYTEDVVDTFTFKAGEEISQVYDIKFNSEGKKGYSPSQSLAKIPEGAEFKIIPSSRPVCNTDNSNDQRCENGTLYREIQYVDPNTDEVFNVAVPQNLIVDANGRAVNIDTPIMRPKEEGREEVAQGDGEESQDVAQENETGVCANPDYIESLVSSDPSCRLVPASGSLVYSSLEAGDALVAKKKDSGRCYKLNIDKEMQTSEPALDQAINDYIERRRNYYDEIAHLLQRGNVGGFVKNSSTPVPNKFTSSCVRISGAYDCTLAIGLRDPEPLRFTGVEIEIPKTGLVSQNTNQKIQVYGPSRDGYYLVKHLEGAKEMRAFVIKEDDRDILRAAKDLIDDYKESFPIKDSMDDYHHVFDQESLQREYPVLRMQGTDSEGELQSRTISMDTNAPMRKLYEMNQGYDYYRMECSYNPLTSEIQPRQEEDSESRPRPRVLRDLPTPTAL